MKIHTYSLHLLRILFPVILAVICSCGGGSDVGNPDINGQITSFDGKAADSCLVVIGAADGDPGRIDTLNIASIFSIVLRSMPFQSVRTNKYGIFHFREMPPGKYSIVATTRDHLVGMYTVNHYRYFDSDTNITANYPAKIVFDNYSSAMDLSSKAFIAARVVGTDITNDTTIRDRILINSVPSGEINFILYRKNETCEYVNDVSIAPKESVTVKIDPARTREAWTFIQKDSTQGDRPYVVYSSPSHGATGDSASINRQKSYDVQLDFSHCMATRLTESAISAFSSDSSTSIDTLWWTGCDNIKIKLCTNKNSGRCVNDSLYLKKGVRYYIVVDTTAKILNGKHMAWPDTISFVPVP